MRLRRIAFCLTLSTACLGGAFAVSYAQISIKRTPLPPEPPAADAAPTTTFQHYDPAKNLTFVEITIPVPSQGESKPVKPAPKSTGNPSLKPPLKVRTWNVSVIFQLAYRGKTTSDLVGGFLTLQLAGKAENVALSASKTVEVNAEGYQYVYERVDDKSSPTVPIDPQKSAAGGTQRLTFKLEPEDLPRIANVNKLEINLGERVLTIGSARLTDLRRTLIAGGTP